MNTFLDQYTALTKTCGFAKLDGRTLIEVCGNDRSTFLHNFCTGDVRRLTPGTGCEAFVTTVQGRTLGYLYVCCGIESLVLDSVAGQAEVLRAHLDRYIIQEDVQLHDRTDEWSETLVAGADSGARLAEILALQADVPRQPLEHVPGQLAGYPVTLLRAACCGSHAFLIRSLAEHAERLHSRLLDAGAVCCTTAAVDAVRIEAGSPQFGVDITVENLPQEVNRNEQAISFEKGCYLGQETVARIDALGHVNRLLVGVRFSSQEVPPAGTPLRVEEQVAGEVTSAAYSPRLAAPLALAYVRAAHTQPGTRLNSPVGDVEVVRLPLE